jgi:hypothetical protein
MYICTVTHIDNDDDDNEDEDDVDDDHDDDVDDDDVDVDVRCLTGIETIMPLITVVTIP